MTRSSDVNNGAFDLQLRVLPARGGVTAAQEMTVPTAISCNECVSVVGSNTCWSTCKDTCCPAQTQTRVC
ncbi:hypothetical protein ABZW11_17935 [Nonomuraea sp. NPDC004580]|uniref:hypothetical protein n=1 Tax=Nonomuraea sp. NPDC004580 TaxID=3154552 RepID=UPI0033B34FBC